MKEMISELVAKLESLNSGAAEFASGFEDILADIARLGDPAAIEALLPFFDDEAEYDEVMFSIVHTLESFNVETYINHLMRGLPDLWKKSPRWAVILHMRLLNDPESLSIYAGLLGCRSPDEKLAVRDVLKAVKERRTEFGERCNELLSKL